MYKPFDALEELYREIDEDKHWTGAESSVRSRYPIRFVLFESFSDFNDFVQECSNHHVYVQSMDKWMDANYDDQLMTYSQLARRFEEYIKSLPANDFVIAPFSEIVRFYDNEKYAEFDALVKTIALIESPEEAQRDHQRIYVPIIGMQGKMTKFQDTPNVHIWEYRSKHESRNYRLILSKSTYGVAGLEKDYTFCRNMKEWVALWKVGGKVKPKIICTSKTIYNNAHHAQPDNAFDYVVCRGAWEFLKYGLNLKLDVATPKEEQLHFWEQLAECVDVDDFDFEQFVNHRFNANNLTDANTFVQIWFECHDDFSRWLLKTYYLSTIGRETYLGRVLSTVETMSTSALFSCMATLIFDDESINEAACGQRRLLLTEALRQNVQITEQAEEKVREKLCRMAADPERGYGVAMKYMSSLTTAEQNLMVEWLGKGLIERHDIAQLFPSLYDYTADFNLQLADNNDWVNDYFVAYVRAKIGNHISDTLQARLMALNENEVAFETWSNRFQTVKTLLYNRSDIDVYYWIDGLGVDWIPFISKEIERHRMDGVYLNEIHLCRAMLPTVTEVNKAKLEEISDNLKKIGDLDSFAHSQKSYPQYLVKEMTIVRDAIRQVLSHYNGKKIAFISDHGLSYMASMGKGLNLAGITPNHAGRCAVWNKGTAPHDNSYKVMDDGKMICALSYNSLAAKIPSGQGAHGGATPEEVLVPVIIVSSQKNASNYSARLLVDEVSSVNPVLKYAIKGLSSIDVPRVEYNGAEYALHRSAGDTFESERLMLVDTATKATLTIGTFKHTDILKINTGAQEDDLFNDF